jgi:hypothetical protein
MYLLGVSRFALGEIAARSTNVSKLTSPAIRRQPESGCLIEA